MAQHFECSDTREDQKCEAKNLVPQGVNGFHGCRNNVFEKSPGLLYRRGKGFGRFCRFLSRWKELPCQLSCCPSDLCCVAHVSMLPTASEPLGSSLPTIPRVRVRCQLYNQVISRCLGVTGTAKVWNSLSCRIQFGRRRMGRSYGFGRKGFAMEESLKGLMQDLGNAINESLSDSDRIAEAIGEIKRAGYDVFLVLEATIGFNRSEDAVDGPDYRGSREVAQSSPESVLSSGKVRFTTQDKRFLKALRIMVDSDLPVGSDQDSDERSGAEQR